MHRSLSPWQPPICHIMYATTRYSTEMDVPVTEVLASIEALHSLWMSPSWAPTSI